MLLTFLISKIVFNERFKETFLLGKQNITILINLIENFICAKHRKGMNDLN